MTGDEGGMLGRRRTGLYTADWDERIDVASGTAAYVRAPRQCGRGCD